MQVEGVIQTIHHHKQESGWMVFTLFTEDGPLRCVGILPLAKEGQRWCLEGELDYHEQYGERFKVQGGTRILPHTNEQIAQYLIHAKIPHIGEKRALALVDAYGSQTLQRLLEDWHAFCVVSGMGETRAKEAHKALQKQRITQEQAIFLQSLGLEGLLIQRLLAELGDQAQAIIEKDPYALIGRIHGFTLAIADQVAGHLGLSPCAPMRGWKLLQYILQEQFYQQGHCYLSEQALLQEAAQRLEKLDARWKMAGVSTAQKFFESKERYTWLSDILKQMVLEGELACISLDGQKVVYLAKVLQMEKNVALHLLSLQEQTVDPLAWQSSFILETAPILLSEEQIEAVMRATQDPVVLITGGPGTGKTTVLRILLQIFDDARLLTQLAAPTGRAAKRMEEATERQAMTIHRLLGYKGAEEALLPEYHEENPLPADVVIVDEMSMIDLPLMHALVQALPATCRLILVGDADQLPSVGPGQILRDLIESGGIPCIRLEHIYRQAQESLIVTNAHRMREGLLPRCNEADKDFFFLRAGDEEQTSSLVLDLMCRRLPKKYGWDPREDIQCLAPMKRGLCGTKNLNAALQARLIPKSEQQVLWRDRTFCVGDKVMQIKNNYQLEWTSLAGEEGQGVYNGDLGYIIEVERHMPFVYVQYEARIVRYDEKTLDELQHAYAMTIHKSQGSEFPCVIIPLVSGYSAFLTRNLLYTAITRAQKMVVLVGDPRVLRMMVENTRVHHRNTALPHWMHLYGALWKETESKKDNLPHGHSNS